MYRIFVIALVLLVAIGAVGYSRGWFKVTNEGQVEVQVDQEKVQDDKESFSKAVSEKAQDLKDQVATLWEESEGLTGDDKTQAQKELSDLKEKRDRLESQIQELEDASGDRFESIKEDLSNNLEDVKKNIVELKATLAKKKAS